MTDWKKWIQNSEKIGAACTGQRWVQGSGTTLHSYSPIDGTSIGSVQTMNVDQYENIADNALKASKEWASWPAPQRGEFIRVFGELLRKDKVALGGLVSVEMGKSLTEGLGEVQEMIDICDYAVGLSRSICGKTLFSERQDHRMYEQWHPLGVVGMITAFNFPVAVWAWNFTIAAICGNSTIWKPSEKTPLTAIACFKILEQALKTCQVPEGVCNLVLDSNAELGRAIAQDPRITLVSATGSSRMGKTVAGEVTKRFGKVLLELGGNNAVILTESAPLDLAIPAIVFGAVGTAGQRCTTTRRVILHPNISASVRQKLCNAYKTLKVGNPLDARNHLGPLIDKMAVENMQQALEKVREQGGEIIHGGEVLSGESYSDGFYVSPALVFAHKDMEIVGEETFAPILYLLEYNGDLDDAIQIQNSVKQGLSSAIFTENLRESEAFLSASGSDCGLANVNIGTSGAEIGGAFGGEKETGGGRESGSDAWKSYMRRQTNTINYSKQLPLAQGVEFDL